MEPKLKYQLVKQTRVCSECGGTVVLLPLKDVLPGSDDPSRVAFRCATQGCEYKIDGGETLKDFPGESVATATVAGLGSMGGLTRERADEL
jgi:hypothetical protein